MKAASAATLAILSSGQILRADLYAIGLVTGSTSFFTNYERPLNGVSVNGGAAQNYTGGWTVTRGATTQSVGLDAQELELTISPKWNNPGGPPLIAGYTLMQAARLGILDNAQVSYAKLFMMQPSGFNKLDVSPGGVGWFHGIISDIDVGRFALQLKISSNIIVLNQTQMPKNLWQAGCVHTVYDPGCAITKAAFTSSGTVGTVTNNGLFNTNLTQANDYFDLGVITFTSGLNNGFQTTVKSYLHTSGVVQTMLPFPGNVAPGDTFTIYPGCDRLQGTCTAKFSNLIHFKATPYVPVPETLYDGGTSNPATQTGGNGSIGQLGNIAGSQIGGGLLP